MPLCSYLVFSYFLSNQKPVRKMSARDSRATQFTRKYGNIPTYKPGLAMKLASGAATKAAREAVMASRRTPFSRGDYGIPRGLKPEVKTVDTSCTAMRFSSDSAAANTTYLINTVPTGNSAVSRIGKKIAMSAVQIRGQINAASASDANKLCLLLVYVRNNNAAAALPAITEIMVAQESSSLTNRDLAQKFKILRRWEFMQQGALVGAAAGQTSASNFAFDEYVPLKQLEAMWTSASTAGTIGEFEKGSLLLIGFGDTAYGATTTPLGFFNTRVYFHDV